MERLPRAGHLIVTFGLLSMAPAIYAQPAGRPTRMIREAVDESKLVVLQGNTRLKRMPETTVARLPMPFR